MEKEASNVRKHGVDFLTVSTIFKYEVVERIDDRDDYGELRTVALGRIELDIYRVTYTWRGENCIRIISAQKANQHERERYYREIYAGGD